MNTTVEDGIILTTTIPPAITPSATYRQISFGLACLTLLICIFGLLGNTCSIIIYSLPSMRSPISVLLLGTACIDFTLSLLSIPTFVIPGICVYTGSPALQDVLAYISVYVYPLTTMMQSASCWAFVVITFERWHTVCRPFAKANWSSVTRSRIALAIVCGLAVLYNGVRFCEFRLDYKDDSDGDGKRVDVVLYLRSDATYMNSYYIGMFVVTHFAIPFPILVVLNGFIIKTICESRKRRRQLNKKERSEHRTAIMMVIVVVTFICCYTLLFSLNILEAADPDFFYSRHTALAFALNDISNVLVVTHAASTIIVYYFFSQKYRQLLILFFAKLSRFPKCVKYTEVPNNGTPVDKEPPDMTIRNRSNDASAMTHSMLNGSPRRGTGQTTAITLLTALPNGKSKLCANV